MKGYKTQRQCDKAMQNIFKVGDKKRTIDDAIVNGAKHFLEYVNNGKARKKFPKAYARRMVSISKGLEKQHEKMLQEYRDMPRLWERGC